jgi:outer membrane lipoprotein-sorting protein
LVRFQTLLSRVALGAALVLSAVAAPGALSGAQAQAGATQLSEADARDVARIEDYFNRITTLEARFLQLSPNGRFAQGSLYMQRPGRLRFEYDDPVPYLLIADGSQVIFYDRELDTPSYVSIGATPLEFLLAETVSLDNGVEVHKIERGPGVMRITLSMEGKADEGLVQITFSERPFALKKWTLIDAEGQALHVAILDPRFDVELDPALFKFDNKKRKAPSSTESR